MAKKSPNLVTLSLGPMRADLVEKMHLSGKTILLNQ
jgi:hypothetical protein